MIFASCGGMWRADSTLITLLASIEDIDKACVLGAGHPMGPFRLNDLTGLDLSYIAMMEKFTRTGDPAELPGPSLVEHYVKGEYGEKTGKGWYHYDSKTNTDR